MWLYPVILLELIVLSGIVYFIIKLIKKKDSNPNIEISIKEGFKSALRELETEKEVEKEMMQKFKDDKRAMGLFSSNDTTEEPINTTDLIPANLSENEKELLRMFYNQ